jgi:molecular chaperone GrpE
VTNEKPPVDRAEDDDTYVIDDTGDLQEVGQKLIDEALGTGQAAPDAAAAGSADLQALRAESQKLRDQYLRSRADFENYRKRSEREKADYYKYALTSPMRDLLPVLDNLERAIAHATDPGEDFQKGIELILKQLKEHLQKYGVKTVGEVSEPFDPALHEAIMQEANPSVPPNTVTDVFQKGYQLHDRLLRPAMVKVSTGSKGEEKPS